VLRIVGFHPLSMALIGLLLTSCTSGPVTIPISTPVPPMAISSPVPPASTPISATHTPTPALVPTVALETTSCMIQYSNPAMGFAVEYPCGWEVITSEPSAGAPRG